MMPPQKMAELGEAMAAAIAANPNDNMAVHRALWEAKMARIAELEATLQRISTPTYGTELHDTDAERADVYWGHIKRMQQDAREALKPK